MDYKTFIENKEYFKELTFMTYQLKVYSPRWDELYTIL